MLFIIPSTATRNAYLMSIIAHEDRRPVLDFWKISQINMNISQIDMNPAWLGIVLGKAVSFFSIFIQKSSTLSCSATCGTDLSDNGGVLDLLLFQDLLPVDDKYQAKRDKRVSAA